MLSFEQLLLEQLRESISYQDLLERVSEYLKNPIIIADSSFRILFMSEYKNEKSIELWDNASDKMYIELKTITEMEQTSILETLEKNIPIRTELPNGYNAFRQPIVVQGRYYGFIGIYDYETPFDETVEEKLQQLEKAVVILMKFSNPFIGHGLDKKAQYLLQMLHASKDSVDLIIERNRDVAVSAEKQLLVFETKKDNDVNLGNVLLYMDMCPLLHYSVVDQGRLISLICYNLENENHKEAGNRFIMNLAKEKVLKFSSSFVFENDSFIPAAYQQCLFTLQNTGEDFCCFEDIIAQAILAESTRNVNAEYFIHPAIYKLEKYDLENKSDYLTTLFVYLSNLGNMRNTADHLYLHYNTLKYRIEKIEEIINIPLNKNEHSIITLYLSMLLYQKRK